MTEALLWAAAVALIAVGLAGTVLPGLPGAVLVFAGLLLAAWIDGFARVGWPTLLLLGLLTALSFVTDLVTTSVGATKTGASRWAVAGAAAGAVAGVFFGPLGLFLGPFAGAVAGELLSGRGLRQAGRAGLGAWVGFLLGTLARLALVFAMLGLFAAAYFFPMLG